MRCVYVYTLGRQPAVVSVRIVRATNLTIEIVFVNDIPIWRHAANN